MAITTNILNVQGLPSNGPDWQVSLYSADLTGCEIIKAAVAANSIFLTKIMIRTATAMTITIGSGETTGAVTTNHLGPIDLDAASGFFPMSFGANRGMRCTSGLALTIDSSAAGAVWIYAEGKVCVDSLKT